MVAVSAIAFTLLELAPGSFAGIARLSNNTTGLSAAATSEATSQLQARYSATIPPWHQYLIFLKGAVHWDFGPSYEYPQLTVQHIIATAFPVSATLALLGMAIALIIAIPIGVVAAVRRSSKTDYITMAGVTVLYAVPNYLAGLCLTLVFSTTLHLLPTQGWTGPSNIILPALALGLAPAGILARYVRSSVLETLREEYVVAAIAKGASPFVLSVRHVLRNSLIPLVTVVGPLLAEMMVGTVFVETIFGVPGMGLYFADAARQRDLPLLMGTTVFFAIVIMLMNLIVDLSYGVLDPRVRGDLGSRRNTVRWRGAGDVLKGRLPAAGSDS